MAQPPVAEVPAPGGGVVRSLAVNGIDAISALFMHDHVYNEFVLDTGTKSGTDWVVTMPTKRYYYTPVEAVGISHAVTKLFQRNFGRDGACDDITLLLVDREEFNVPVQVGFSPPKPGQKSNTLCWEANVITFNGTNVLGSSNSRNVPTTFQNGWGDLSIPSISATRAPIGSAVVEDVPHGRNNDWPGNVHWSADNRVCSSVVQQRHAERTGCGRLDPVAVRRQFRPQDAAPDHRSVVIVVALSSGGWNFGFIPLILADDWGLTGFFWRQEPGVPDLRFWGK